MGGPGGQAAAQRGPTPARAIALRVLLRVERGAFANAALDEALTRAALSNQDRALVTALVDGTLRWRGRLDYSLTYYLARPLGSVPPAIRAILRLGAFQLLLMNAIPARAACDEAVRMARARGHPGTAALVNAVLRRLAASGEPAFPDRAADEAGFISVAHSHPRWLVERWIARYGSTVAEAICEADNRPAPVSLRPNRLKTTPEALTASLAADGMEVAPSPVVPGALRLVSGGNPARATAYARGLFAVQGDASILVGLICRPAPDSRVVDLCAGVGGKTTHLAELMGDSGHIVAVDRDERRLQRLLQECERLGITVIETRGADARVFDREGGFDLCLLDAPCSGTGALRRRVDSRWRKAPQQVAQLAALQRQLIAQAVRLVRLGGVVVYSVCSLEPEEGEGVVGGIVAEGRLRLEDSRGIVCGVPDSAFGTGDGTIRLMPHLHDTDGMFIARLSRAS
jgi:16S rRNA (cytosine967-C5)-methyltransferase